MTEDTKTTDDAQATAALETTPTKRGRKSNGKSSQPQVPAAKARLTSSPDPEPEQVAVADPLGTQLIETIDGPAPVNGNGNGAARLAEVRPVKARLGGGYT